MSRRRASSANESVALLDEPLQLDFLLVQREAVRLEPREVDEVADEPGEPIRRGADDLERGRRRLRIVGEALPQSRDVAADRGQRRSQLVRDADEEVALVRLGLREPLRHLAEPLREVADLVARPRLGELGAVAPLRHLVCRPGKGEQRLREAPAQVPHESERDRKPDEKRETQASR